MGKQQNVVIQMELEKEPDKKELEDFWTEQICRILIEKIPSLQERKEFIEDIIFRSCFCKQEERKTEVTPDS